MDTRKVLIIGAVVIVLGGIGWFALSQSKGNDPMMEDKTMMEKSDETTMQKDDSAMMEKKDDGAMMKDEGALMEKDGDAMMQQ